MGRLSRFLLIFLIVFSATSSAQEQSLQDTTEYKLMSAAAVVLAKFAETPVGIRLQSADLAFGYIADPHFRFDHVEFRRVSTCVYAETYFLPKSDEKRFAIIDFNKLSGRYSRTNMEVIFYGKPNTACRGNGQAKRQCLDGVMSYNIETQRFIDDTNFILNNGCGDEARFDPY